MDGFKKTIKMKTGGSVDKAVAAHEKKEMAAEKKGMHSDIKEDKKLVKKAINIHDDQLHEGAKTDLSKLKKGGRCKKTGGTVRKYAAGGLTESLERGKKRPRPTEPPGGVEPDDVPRAPEQAYKRGGKVKKMADGSLTGPLGVANQAAGVQANPLQNAAAAALLRRKLAMAGQQPGGLAGAPAAPVGQPQPQDIGPTPSNIGATTGPIMKKGGKVKKGCK